MKNVKCLISDAPSVSIEGIFRDVAKSVFRKSHAKVFSYVTDRFLVEFNFSAMNFDRVRNISQAKYPLLLSAGSNEQMDDILNIFLLLTQLLGQNFGNG